MKFTVEYTDTFNGEANYGWAKRACLEFDEEPSDMILMRRAKRQMGLSGVPGKTSKMGDVIEFRPYRMNTVMFIFCS